MVPCPAHSCEQPVRRAGRENDDGDMATWQLYDSHLRPKQTYLSFGFISIGYMLLGLISSFVFRAIRDTLPNNPEAQERILGASMTALALADVSTPIPYRVSLWADHDAVRSRSESVARGAYHKFVDEGIVS